MDYIFPTLHSDEITKGSWRVVTSAVASRSNNSRAHSAETNYRSGSFWGYWHGEGRYKQWIADEPGNYITSRGEE